MGNKIDCCEYRKEEKQEIFSKKIMKIYSERERKTIGKYILCYDIESNHTEKKYLPTILKSIKGLGELIYMNVLYLCGGDDSFLGSNHFFKYNTENGLQPLSNCIYSHKFPTLIGVGQSIYCIGGLEDNIHCEKYLIDHNRWESINPLPSSRFGCTAFFDEKTNCLYLIGGYNYIKNRMLDSIIQMKLSQNHCNFWEEINIIGGELLKKSMMGIIKLESNSILLLGGFQYNEEKCCDVETDQVIKLDIDIKISSEEDYKLFVPAVFNSKNSVDFGYDCTDYLIDDNFNVHKFNKDEKRFDCISRINDKILDSSI